MFIPSQAPFDRIWTVCPLALALMACGGGSHGSQPVKTLAAPGPTLLDPGPGGNVPAISLPDCLGILPYFQSEWWYYVGYLHTREGELFSLQLQALRARTLDASLGGQLALGVVGLGRAKDQSYLWSQGYGLGVGQTAGGPQCLEVQAADGLYDVALKPWFGFPSPLAALAQYPATVAFHYSGGAAVGTKGSTYALSASGTGGLWRSPPPAAPAALAYDLSLEVEDHRGMVLEGDSGFVGTDAIMSYEFAQPTLTVTGGSLKVGGETLAVDGGSLWLDRQGLDRAASPLPTPPSLDDPQGALTALLADPGTAPALGTSNNALYLGTWMALNLDNGAAMNLASFWQPSTPQWRTGSALGLPPLPASFGNLHFPLDGTKRPSGSAYLYGYDQGAFDFDVNLPAAPLSWISPVSGHTYALAWDLSFGPAAAAAAGAARLHLKALVQGCENLLPNASNAFWEGAVAVTDDSGATVGHGFVEQMGFN